MLAIEIAIDFVGRNFLLREEVIVGDEPRMIEGDGARQEGIAFAPSTPGLVWAISSAGTVLLKTDINANGPWRIRGSTTGSVMGLAVNSCYTDRLYILRDGGLEMSPDGGATFAAISGSGTTALPSKGLLAVFAHPDDPGILIVGAVGGIFLSMNEGSSWGRYDWNLPNAAIKQVLLVDDLLYADTVGRGLWRRRPSPSILQLAQFSGVVSLVKDERSP